MRDKDFIKYAGHRVKISVAEKIEKKRNFRGKLVDFVEKNGEKVLVVDVEGKIYNIPRDIVVKANLQYEF